MEMYVGAGESELLSWSEFRVNGFVGFESEWGKVGRARGNGRVVIVLFEMGEGAVGSEENRGVGGVLT